jgi:iron-sulfur cluster repair protein YtfE (RIC family)
MATPTAERSVAELLTEDHDQIDALFERAAKGDASALAAFKGRLRAHMQVEEELLFPLLDDASFSAPVAVMKKEHDRLRELLEEDDFEFIGNCLGSHNSKEERVIYPACTGPRFAPIAGQISAALSRATVHP